MRMLSCVVGSVMTNCYILIEEKTRQAALIDPGDEADRLLEVCEKQGLSIKAILLTHGHYDHILAVGRLREKTGAPVYAAEAETSLLGDAQINLSASWEGRSTVVTADVCLQDSEEISLFGHTVRMLLTPGHTAGSCCYLLPEEGWLFSGDTLFYESYGRTDLPTGSSAQIRRSLRERLFALPQETEVFPGHGEGTTIGHEKKYNPLA